ncbi:unnamed protein product [Notodromas monacha]|uniref:Uncharacterized protein n=1 Tax=Notodromas monacha TaxID=399045 RepID=A0A7R9BQC8_9CRUS|nr:unnamed protein product [Notodromas monacha]CAG0918871.1 unnamed protein product [Notodromas monacha]
MKFMQTFMSLLLSTLKTLGLADKTYIKKGTAAFFGVVEEGNVEEEDALKSRWLERRKRFSAKKFGELKDAFAAPCQREGEDDIDFWRRTRQRRDAADVSNVSATQRDGSDVLGIPTPQHPIPKPRKESVARLTIRGVSFLASVSLISAYQLFPSTSLLVHAESLLALHATVLEYSDASPKQTREEKKENDCPDERCPAYSER